MSTATAKPVSCHSPFLTQIFLQASFHFTLWIVSLSPVSSVTWFCMKVTTMRSESQRHTSNSRNHKKALRHVLSIITHKWARCICTARCHYRQVQLPPPHALAKPNTACQSPQPFMVIHAFHHSANVKFLESLTIKTQKEQWNQHCIRQVSNIKRSIKSLCSKKKK